MNYRIFELPIALCSGGVPAIQLLCQRDKLATSGGQLWLGKNFALSGAPPESYGLLQTFRRFAWHGFLTADYTADTLCIDTRLGMSFQLDGPDQILEDVTDFDALGGAFWVFVDDEILFLANPVMLAPGAYKIHAIRGQYGSPIQDHDAGADVYIIRSADFSPITFPAILPGNLGQYKLTLGVQQVGDQDAVTSGYVGSMFAISPPTLLAVNGVTISPIIPVSTDFAVTWQPPSINGTLPSTAKLSILVEIITPTTTFSARIASPATSYAATWADLPADANCGFTLQATSQVDTGDEIISGDPEQLVVGVSGPGLVAHFRNETFGTHPGIFTDPVVLTRVDANIDVDYGGVSPGGSVNAIYYSVRWTGCIVSTADAGVYAFSFNSDDGTRLWINGQLIIDNWDPGGTMTQNFTMAANTRYSIIVEYWQYEGPSFVQLAWQPPSAGAPVSIPSTNLLTA